MGKKIKWSSEEEQYLIDNYQVMAASEIGGKLKRSTESVKHKTRELGIKKEKRKKWSEADIDFLRKNYSEKGNKYCGKHLNRTTCSLSKKARELGLTVRKKPVIPKHTLQAAVNKSYCMTNLFDNLGKVQSGASYKVVKSYLKQYGIDTSHFDPFKKHKERISNGEVCKAYPIEHYLKYGSKIGSSNLKSKLYKEGLKERKCEMPGCGQGEEWMGNKISLILDHINGDSKDNRLDNLRIVCPNCNAALPTHCRGKKAFSHEKTKRELALEESERQRQKNGGFTDAELASSKNQRRVERPPIEVLKKEIKEMGYAGTARKYGVSDSSIRKWLKSMVMNNS